MRYRVLIFNLLFFSFVAYSQNFHFSGNIPLYNIYPSEYPRHHPQNHTVKISDSGKVYIANNIGVNIYDGVNWTRLANLSKKALAITISEDQRIFVGGEDEFGEILVDSIGKEYYKSFMNLIPDSLQNLGRLNDLYSINDKLFIVSPKRIIELQNDTYSSHVSEVNCVSSFSHEGRLFIYDKDGGLLEYLEGDLHRSKLNLHYQKPSKILKSGNVILSFKETLVNEYIIKTKGVEFLQSSSISKNIPDEDVECFIDFSDYRLIGTKTDGLLIFDKDFKLVKKINSKNSELQSDYIKDLYIDKHENLWLTLDNGISVIDISSKISKYGKNENILGTINNIAGNKSNVYLACTQGLLELNLDTGKSFNDVDEVKGECWDVKNIKIGRRQFLLVATDNSIEMYEGGIVTNIIKAFPWFIHQSRNDPNRIWIGDDNGFLSLYWNGKSFDEEIINIGLKVQIRMITTDGRGNIWLGGRKGWLYHINEEDIKNGVDVKFTTFNDEDGFQESSYFFPYIIYGKVFIATTHGIYSFNKDSTGFIRSPEFNSDIEINKRIILRMHELTDQKVWVVSKIEGTENFENGIFDLSIKKWNYKSFTMLNKGLLYGNYLDMINNDFWVGGTEQLFRINSFKKIEDYEFNAFISQIKYDPDSIMFGGHMFEGFTNNTYNYSRKPLRFSFGANSYKRKNDLKFKYFLQGFDETWTDWNEEAEAVYTNLPAGKYNMRVKAIDFFENESEEASFSFTILPPWYLTKWAYTLYFFGFIGFVYGAVKVSTISLQRVIKDNTKEIVAQKDEIEAKNSVLEKQKGRIEKQNLNILDSIRYAKRIQMATLPAEDKIQKSVENAWVMYRPKDIVSGDFYWLENNKDEKAEKTLLAAVDCTGHGVPGAFMSIIGYNGLNRVVREYKLNKPSDVLDRLNEIITTTLNQQGAQREEIKDGMDMSLCSLDRKNLKLEYAGAHNSLYIIRKGVTKLIVNGDEVSAIMTEKDHKLFEIKADKQPIGAFENRKNFNNHEIQLMKDDMIILFTDGYADQFGGPKGKKFFYKPFKRLLLSIADEHVEKQHEIIEQTFNEWISYPDSNGDAHEQIDDICVLGVRV